MKYYIGATNGNSRGSEIDNDQSKHVYARLEKDFKDDLKIGVNGGIGSYINQSGNVIGADVEKSLPSIQNGI